MTSIWWWLLWTFVCGLAVLLSVAGAAAAVKARTRKARVRDGVAVNVGGSVAAKIASRATAAAGWWFLMGLIYDGAHGWARIFWRWPRTRHKVRGTGFARPTI